MAEAKPVTSKQIMRKVIKLGVSASGRIDNNICTVGLEKAVLLYVPVPPRKVKVSTKSVKVMISEHCKKCKKTMELELECITGRGNEGGSYGNKILYKNLKFFDKIFVRKSCRRRFRNAPKKSC